MTAHVPHFTLHVSRITLHAPRDVGWFWVLVLAIPAALPLATVKFFISHDGLFHLYRLAALDRALHAGVFYPRWFPEFAFGYGHPVLNFYSPLSYYLAEVFHLGGTGYINAVKLAFAASLIVSGLAMYLFAREMWGQWGSVLAAIAYVYFPYHLADVYVRGALAEAVAFIFPPLVLWALHRLFATQHAGYAIAASVSLAALIATHNLTAMLFAPVAAGYAVLLAWQTKRWCMLGTVTAVFMLAIGLTAFYTLPVAVETQFVGLAEGSQSAGYAKHLVSATEIISRSLAYAYFPNQMVQAEHPIGVVQTILFLASVIALVVLRRDHKQFWPGVFFATVTLIAAFMTLSDSLPIWQYLPALAFLQYPWRFNALVALGSAFVASAIVSCQPSAVSRQPLLVIMLSLAIITASLARLPVQSLTLRDTDITTMRMWQEDYDHQQIGATWTAEYLPRSVQEERWAIPRSIETSTATSALAAIPHLTLGPEGYTHREFDIESSAPLRLVLHQFDFPGWQASVDGISVPVVTTGKLGLVAFDVPAGRHRIAVDFGDTPPRQIGTLVSLTVLLLIIVLLARRERTVLLALGIVLIAAAILLAAHIWPFVFMHTPVPVNANLGNEAKLVGYDLDRSGTYHPGETMKVMLHWLAVRDTATNYKVFVHLMDEVETKVWAQHDGDPGSGFSPTTRWMAGELVDDEHPIVLPAALPPGRYRLYAGMYRFEDLRRLDVLDAAGTAIGDRVPLGTVEIAPK